MYTADELTRALSRTKLTAKVKVVALDGSHVLMNPAEASSLVSNATDWEGFGTGHNIRSIRRVNRQVRKPDPVWAACWRNMQAAVLPPAPEWFLGMRSSR